MSNPMEPRIEARSVVERKLEAPGMRFLLRTTGTGLFLSLMVSHDAGGPGFTMTGGQLRALYRLLNAGVHEVVS